MFSGRKEVIGKESQGIHRKEIELHGQMNFLEGGKSDGALGFI